MAQFFVAQEAHKHMSHGGRLILISSISAVMGFPRHALYSASKAANTGMVKCLAHDFGSGNITVNRIAPGGIESDMLTAAAKDCFPGGEEMCPMGTDAQTAAMSPFNRLD